MNYDYFENILKLCFQNKVLVEIGSYNILGFGNPEAKNVLFLDTIYTEDEVVIPQEISFEKANTLCIEILKKSDTYDKLKNALGDDFLDKWYITFANRDVRNKESMQATISNRVWNRLILAMSFEKFVFVGRVAWNAYTEDIEIRKTLESGRKIDEKYFFVDFSNLLYNVGVI